jgi:hypothetical protein
VKSGLGEKTIKNKPQNKKNSDQQLKEMDCDEPHLVSNEKKQAIQCTERPTAGSLCPLCCTFQQPQQNVKMCRSKTIFLSQTSMF